MIHDLAKFTAGLWDWSILDGCFGTSRIAPSDLDGLVEVNGRFLVLEAKSPGVPVKAGQAITFAAMAATNLFTVIVIWGHPGAPEHMQIIGGTGTTPKLGASMVKLRDVVRQWYSWAQRQHTPSVAQCEAFVARFA